MRTYIRRAAVLLLLLALTLTPFPLSPRVRAEAGGAPNMPPFPDWRSFSHEEKPVLEAFSLDGTLEMVEVPASSFQKAPSGLFAPPPNFEVEKLVDNGPDFENIVLTILGDGFTAGEQDSFMASAKAASDYLLDFHPFKSFQHKFNVYAIKVISNASGAANRPSALIDNYFGSTFRFDGVTERLLYISYPQKAYELLNYYTPKCDIPIVLVNSLQYGGAGGAFAAASLDPGSVEIVVHELGHSIGGLADEYWWSGEEAPNMTRDNNPATIKWKPWLGLENIGIYPHIESPTWFRPHENCEMRNLYSQFCEVCATQITSVMTNITFEAFYGRGALEGVIIPPSARIGDYTFYGCESLQGVTISGGVLSIGRYAFLNCKSLTSVINYNVIPQTITEDVFSGVSRSNITLYVPAGAEAAYMAAGWTGFGAIIGIDADTVLPGHNVPKAAAPTVSRPPGKVLRNYALRLYCDTPRAAIHYTTDGSDPNTSSDVFGSSPIIIAGDVTIKAYARYPGMRDSDIVTFEYTAADMPHDPYLVPDMDYSGFYIDLESEMLILPDGYQVAGYSTDGLKWKKGAPNLTKLFNKALPSFQISDSFDNKSKKPANGAHVISFPYIANRPPRKPVVNYAICADPTGATPGAWTLTMWDKTTRADFLIAKSSNKKTPDSGWAVLPAEGVPVLPYGSAKETYLVKAAPVVRVTGDYISAAPGSKLFKITPLAQQKPVKIKADYKKEIIKLKTEGMIFGGDMTALQWARDNPPWAASSSLFAQGWFYQAAARDKKNGIPLGAVLDEAAANGAAICLWTPATDKKPASMTREYKLAVRAAAPSQTIDGVNGKVTLPSALEVFYNNKWGKLPKFTATTTLENAVRVKSTAKATGVDDSSQKAASKAVRLTVEVGSGSMKLIIGA